MPVVFLKLYVPILNSAFPLSNELNFINLFLNLNFI